VEVRGGGGGGLRGVGRSAFKGGGVGGRGGKAFATTRALRHFFFIAFPCHISRSHLRCFFFVVGCAPLVFDPSAPPKGPTLSDFLVTTRWKLGKLVLERIIFYIFATPLVVKRAFLRAALSFFRWCGPRGSNSKVCGVVVGNFFIQNNTVVNNRVGLASSLHSSSHSYGFFLITTHLNVFGSPV
jgi:hypothetical protein